MKINHSINQKKHSLTKTLLLLHITVFKGDNFQFISRVVPLKSNMAIRQTLEFKPYLYVDKEIEGVNVLLDESFHLQKSWQQFPFLLCTMIKYYFYKLIFYERRAIPDQLKS